MPMMVFASACVRWWFSHPSGSALGGRVWRIYVVRAPCRVCVVRVRCACSLLLRSLRMARSPQRFLVALTLSVSLESNARRGDGGKVIKKRLNALLKLFNTLANTYPFVEWPW